MNMLIQIAHDHPGKIAEEISALRQSEWNDCTLKRKDLSGKKVKLQWRKKSGLHEYFCNNAAKQSGMTMSTKFWGERKYTLQILYPTKLSFGLSLWELLLPAWCNTFSSVQNLENNVLILSGKIILLKNLKWKKNKEKAKMWLKVKIKQKKGRQVGRKDWGWEQTI